MEKTSRMTAEEERRQKRFCCEHNDMMPRTKGLSVWNCQNCLRLWSRLNDIECENSKKERVWA